MKESKKRELFLKNLDRIEELENEIPFPHKLTEDRVNYFINLYQTEIRWILEVGCKLPVEERKKCGFDKPKDLEDRLSGFKNCVIVLHQLLNTPSYLIPYTKEKGEYSFCKFLVEEYLKETKEN